MFDVVWTLNGPNSGSLTIAGVPTISFSNVSELVGGSGADQFIVKDTYSRTVSIKGGAGNDQLVISAGVPASLTFDGEAGFDSVVNKAGAVSMPTFNSVENFVDRPLLFVPGFGGSFVDTTKATLDDWYLTRGLDPTKLILEPLANSYSDFIQTLVNSGYTDGTNQSGIDGTLYVSLWDWRDPVAVSADGTADGFLTDVTAASIRDWALDSFDSGLDYFAYWMDQAATHWQTLTGAAPDSVDVITHSTGGLIARSYEQSAAYNQPGLNLLPINTLIQTGVPNQGVGSTFGMLNDDFSLKASARGLASMVNAAYELIKSGQTLKNPDGSTVTNANLPGEVAFVGQYIASFKDLLATYSFVDNVDDGSLVFAALDATSGVNGLLLDLNAVDPTGFVGIANQTHVVYSMAVDTPDLAIRHSGFVASLGTQNEILPFSNVIGRLPAAGEAWYEFSINPAGGDGTVPANSASDGFAGLKNSDLSDVLFEITSAAAGGPVEHSGIVHNEYSQTQILRLLGIDGYALAQLSTGILLSQKAAALNLIQLGLLDPVEVATQAFSDAKALVSDIHDRIEVASNQDLPVLGRSLNELLGDNTYGLGFDLFAAFSNAVAGAVSSIGTVDQRLAQLEELLEDQLGLADVGGDPSYDNPELELAYDGANGILSMTFDFNLSKTSTFDLDLGATAGPLSGPPIALDMALGLDLAFTVKLDFGEMISFAVGGAGTNGLLLTLDNFDLSAILAVPGAAGPAFTLNFDGIGDLSVSNLSATIAAGLAVNFIAPGNTVSLGDLRTKSFGSLVTFTPSGQFDLGLDSSASIVNPAFALSGTGSLNIHTGDMFSGLVPAPVMHLNSASLSIADVLFVTGDIDFESGADGLLKISGTGTGTGSNVGDGGTLTNVLVKAGPVSVGGTAAFSLARQTVDVDTDGSGAADLIGAMLDAFAISVTNASVAVIGVADLTVTGTLTLARVTAAGETTARYTALKMGAMTGTGALDGSINIGLTGSLTISRLDYNGAAAGFGRMNWANAFDLDDDGIFSDVLEPTAGLPIDFASGLQFAVNGSATGTFDAAPLSVVLGSTTVALTQQTVDADTDGNGSADLLGASLMSLALDATNVGVAITGVTAGALTVTTGKLALATLKPAAVTDLRSWFALS